MTTIQSTRTETEGAALVPPRPRGEPVGAPMPWGTITVLAVLMSFADGFVMTAVQNAVGAIERTSEPFLSWLITSTLLLPVFFLAVLGAFAFARRRLGPVLRGPRAVAAAALLVVLAGSVVGTAEVVASAMVDYHLQSEQIVATSKVHVHTHVHATGAAGSECISCVQQQLSLAADATGARDAGRILLGANVVIVAWVTAMRGGRLGTTTRRRTAARG